MQINRLGQLFDVSQLALGGGGIGQVWGQTDRAEAVATVREAYQRGITFFDMAPSYGNGEAETVMGQAFASGYPEDVRVTSKCMVGTIAPDQVEQRLRDSLQQSLQRLQRDAVDVFILHGFVIEPDDFSQGQLAKLAAFTMPWDLYQQHIVPVLEVLKTEGKIGHWGITAAGRFDTDSRAIQAAAKPSVVQCISNAMDSAGDMSISKATGSPRDLIKQAGEQQIGVMGIRAVAAGALCDEIDREVSPRSRLFSDYQRADKFRSLAKQWSMSAAQLAHRVALDIAGVDTLVLGVKNRQELDECCIASEMNPLTDAQLAAVQNCF